jgi:succinate-acetate transporter protein
MADVSPAARAAVEPTTPVPPALPLADPAPLGLGAFALTTFVLSVHNAFPVQSPDLTWIGLAFFYGGLAQFMAGMFEFRNRNVFGATAFSTYGAFWLSLGFFVLFLGKAAGADFTKDLGWFLLAFAVFNTYMLLWSARVSGAVFGVFLTLEITEILLFIGFFILGFGNNPNDTAFIRWGGGVGIITAVVAWYASAAGVINGLAGRPVVPVGAAFWRG